MSASNPNNTITPGTVICFQDQGVPKLGLVTAISGSRFEIVDESGVSAKFSADRMTAFPGIPSGTSLGGLGESAEGAISGVSLAEVWESCEGMDAGVSSEEIFNRAGLKQRGALGLLGLHSLLLRDRIYFKQRGQLFQRRNKIEVATRIEQAAAQERHQKRLDELVEIITARLSGTKDRSSELPGEIRLLEELAALGNEARYVKDARAVLERVEEATGTTDPRSEQGRAFDLLVRLGHFTPDQNLTLIKLGLDRIEQPNLIRLAGELSARGTSTIHERVDLTALECFTIDSGTTTDFDDAFSVERVTGGGCRIGVHITDVWSALSSDPNALDEALIAGASTYLPDRTVHMLPPALAEDLLSLRRGETRSALTLLVSFDSDSLQTDLRFQLSTIKVARNLSYDQADELLSSGGDEALNTLWQMASTLEERRLTTPSFSFDRPEISLTVAEGGEVTLSTYNNDSPARRMVAELMVLYNSEAAKLGKRLRAPLLYRSQDRPDEDPASLGLDIPEGPARDSYQRSAFQRTVTSCRPLPHAGLGLECYLQATSPLRRAIDLLNQGQLIRLILETKEPIPSKKMMDLYREIEPTLDRINLAQRDRIRYFLLKYLLSKNVTRVAGTLIKVDHGQPYVELEETLLFAPFQPKTPFINRASAQKQLGRRVELEITEIDLRAGKITLVEV